MEAVSDNAYSESEPNSSTTSKAAVIGTVLAAAIFAAICCCLPLALFARRRRKEKYETTLRDAWEDMVLVQLLGGTEAAREAARANPALLAVKGRELEHLLHSLRAALGGTPAVLTMLQHSPRLLSAKN
eukprot:gene32383-41049_t